MSSVGNAVSRFYRQDFRTQLLWLVLVSVLLAIILFSWASMVLQRRLAVKEFDNATRATIEAAELGLVIGLQEENFESITTVLTWVKENDNVSFIALSDSSGQLIAYFPEDLDISAESISALPRELSLTDSIFVRTGTWSASFSGTGTLFIGFSTAYLREIERIALRNLLLVMLLVLAGSMAVAYRMAGGLIRPLEQLKRVTDRIALNDTELRADPTEGSREVQSMAGAFNNMLDQLLESQRQRVEEMQRFNESLEERNLRIQEINQQILDSIAYSRLIQQSILPVSTMLETSRYSTYRIFRPRDIVSGDFYWAVELDGRYYWAVVDCTGHGVPGAFMTLVGGSYLEQAVKQIRGTDPAAILDAMHASVRRFLKQDTDEPLTQDGMDMGLMIFDPAVNRVFYAGARRPLYVADSSGDFAELKGTRRSIGGKVRGTEEPFATHELGLRPGMTFYLSTDGFADQNNSADKKIGSRRLQETLQNISILTMFEQQARLESWFDQHRGDEPQRDDVTLLALRWNASV